MSGVGTQLIQELLQEQNLDSEDVFCPEGGHFQVIDIRGGKIDRPAIFMITSLERFHGNNQGSPGNVKHLEIDNEISFQDLLSQERISGTRIMCVYSYLAAGFSRLLRAIPISTAL